LGKIRLAAALGVLAYLNWDWVSHFVGLTQAIKMLGSVFSGNFGDLLRWFAGKEKGKATDWGLLGSMGSWLMNKVAPAAEPLDPGGLHPFQKQSFAPTGALGQPVQVHTAINLDGHKLADAVSHHIAVGASIVHSAAMFDGRMSPMSVDMGA
jgi:hypothetical protein